MWLGEYPIDGPATVTVKLEHPEAFSLWVRVPAWSEQTSIHVNDQAVVNQPGTYAKIHRTWSSGDSVTIQFDLRGRVVEAEDGNGQIAICRGPIVLSLDNRLSPAAVGAATINHDDSHHVMLRPNHDAAAKIKAWQAFDAEATIDGKPATLTFCDYADAGSGFSRENFYRTWLPQPLDLEKIIKTVRRGRH